MKTPKIPTTIKDLIEYYKSKPFKFWILESRNDSRKPRCHCALGFLDADFGSSSMMVLQRLGLSEYTLARVNNGRKEQSNYGPHIRGAALTGKGAKMRVINYLKKIHDGGQCHLYGSLTVPESIKSGFGPECINFV